MSNETTMLVIEHNGILFQPPILSGISIEWERTGYPGKLTFTTIRVKGTNMSFLEGDRVRFYYQGNPVFLGYVFTKKRDKEHHIEVTCYDQIRYLKNEYTYLFENKSANQIIESLCRDFNLNTGNFDDTEYIIPYLIKEKTSALDIVEDVLEETLTNTGNRFVLYDEFGTLQLKNCANMVSDVLVFENTAENFDYSSSIDEETYNEIVLYYKQDNTIIPFSASDQDKIKQWGTLRYFEEVTSPSIAQNKADALLKLYSRKTRNLEVSGAFGDISIRGGTLIPVNLDLGDIVAKQYMIVESVTHNFEDGIYTMDLKLEGAWENS